MKHSGTTADQEYGVAASTELSQQLLKNTEQHVATFAFDFIVEMHLGRPTKFAADALIVPLTSGKPLSEEKGSVLHKLIRAEAGEHYHAQLEFAAPLLPLQALVAIRSAHNAPAFGDVIFVNGNQPIDDALFRAFEAAKERGVTRCVLPVDLLLPGGVTKETFKQHLESIVSSITPIRYALDYELEVVKLVLLGRR